MGGASAALYVVVRAAQEDVHAGRGLDGLGLHAPTRYAAATALLFLLYGGLLGLCARG